jgi:hypothetical protein
MEPFINDGLSGGVDLTRFVFEDLGWLQPRVTGVDGGARRAASGLRLAGARPNPFGGSTTIAFDLAREAEVAIDVFNPAGRIVRRLSPGTLPAGPHAIVWDGAGDGGARLTPGVYFVRLRAGAESAVRRAVVLAPR